MEGINEQLDQLFERWQKEQNLEFFVKDGIMLQRGKDNEVLDNEWLNSSRRILFMLKDQNQGDYRWPEDAREWILKSDDTADIKQRSIHKIANLLYGLSIVNQHESVPFNSLDHNIVRSHFNTMPFAIMESKKEPGKNSLKDNVLWKCIKRDEAFISKEIELLKPNIIVCFGSPIYNYFQQFYADENLQRYSFSDKIIYSPKCNAIILRINHPSDRTGYFKHYENSMAIIRMFLKSDDGKRFLGE